MKWFSVEENLPTNDGLYWVMVDNNEVKALYIRSLGVFKDEQNQEELHVSCWRIIE